MHNITASIASAVARINTNIVVSRSAGAVAIKCPVTVWIYRRFCAYGRPCHLVGRIGLGTEHELTTFEEIIEFIEYALDSNEPAAPAPRGLKELVERINEFDVTSLPVFGGLGPADTHHVWSWDHASLLVSAGEVADGYAVGNTGFAIVPRREWND